MHGGGGLGCCHGVYLMGFPGEWLLVANSGLIFSYGFDFVLWV